MIYKIYPPSVVNGKVQLPSSKSISNRVLMINALSYSPLEIKNLSESDDTQVMWKALNSNLNTFDVGPAGTAMRFLTSFLSKIVGEWTVTGSERMKNRPIKILVDALVELGAKIEYAEKEGYPPLKIFGSALKGKTIELQGNVSSQYISALLMIGPSIENGLTIKLVNEIVSRPYINMTLSLMHYFGAQADWASEDTIVVKETGYQVKDYFVESDWSGASYWFEIAALMNDKVTIQLPDLFEDSLQGDAELKKIYTSLGVNAQFSNVLEIKNNIGAVERFEYDFVHQPDLAQTVVVTCALKGIPFKFIGLQSLKIKETDRIAALISELKKLGYVIAETANGVMEWNGERCEGDKDPIIETYDDHRMAMAFAPAAICFPGLKIKDPAVVSKSYPGYWDDLKLVGFVIDKLNA